MTTMILNKENFGEQMGKAYDIVSQGKCLTISYEDADFSRKKRENLGSKNTKKLTENGFTEEFEEEVLKAGQELTESLKNGTYDGPRTAEEFILELRSFMKSS